MNEKSPEDLASNKANEILEDVKVLKNIKSAQGREKLKTYIPVSLTILFVGILSLLLGILALVLVPKTASNYNCKTTFSLFPLLNFESSKSPLSIEQQNYFKEKEQEEQRITRLLKNSKDLVAILQENDLDAGKKLEKLIWSYENDLIKKDTFLEEIEKLALKYCNLNEQKVKELEPLPI